MSNKCFEYVRWGPRGGQAILTLRSLAVSAPQTALLTSGGEGPLE